jgi:asparagine synthase (glutamine-hydrolysing)
VVAVAQAEGAPAGVYGALRALLTDRQIQGLMPAPAFRCIAAGGDADPNSDSSGDFVNDLSRMELAGYLRSTLLRDTDVMSMANSLEVRVPFLDHKLVEYVLALPGAMKLEGLGNKPLLFESVPELPAEVGLRPKMGFVLPLEQWFRGPMKTTMEDTLLDFSGPSSGILRRKAVAAAWGAFLSGDGTVSATRALALASLSSWVTEHDLVLPW